MEILLVILLIIFLFPFMAATGWLMKGLEVILKFMCEGAENFLGCTGRIFIFIFVVIVLIALIGMLP